TRFSREWSSDVCSSDLGTHAGLGLGRLGIAERADVVEPLARAPARRVLRLPTEVKRPQDHARRIGVEPGTKYAQRARRAVARAQIGRASSRAELESRPG